MSLFLTADSHFSHKRIIEYCNRPFSTVEEMNEALVAAWNAKVTPNDEVWHLGDFSWGDPKPFFRRLNGKINFILGNHDKREKLQELASVYDLHHLHLSKHELIVLCHYAMRVWNKSHHGSYHCYGHSHNTLEHTQHGKSMDVGVDSAYKILGRYEPFAYEEIKRILDKRDIAVLDHHGESDG